MADTTNFCFRVHHVPEDQLHAFCEAVGEAFEDHAQWGVDWSWRAESDEDKLAALLAMMAPDGDIVEFTDEASTGAVINADLAALVAAAPGAIWECHTEPAYEWLGDWAGHHPTTGLLGPVECNSDGTQMLDASQVETGLIAYAHHKADEDGQLEVGEMIAYLFPQRAFNQALQSETVAQ